MNNLDIERINEYAPYKVEEESGQYIFETDHGILYGVSFDEETMTEMVKDGDEENYIALIVKRDHPQLQTIIDVFNKQIAMFRANKPQ